MNIIPINPLISPQGNLVSLEMLRGNLLAAPIPLDAGTAVGNVSVARQQISVSAAGKLGLGSIFGLSVTVNEAGFWMDAMGFADSPYQPNPNNIVSQTRWGYGLRILVPGAETRHEFQFELRGARRGGRSRAGECEL
jgi:hypothetical protein